MERVSIEVNKAAPVYVTDSELVALYLQLRGIRLITHTNGQWAFSDADGQASRLAEQARRMQTS